MAQERENLARSVYQARHHVCQLPASIFSRMGQLHGLSDRLLQEHYSLNGGFRYCARFFAGYRRVSFAAPCLSPLLAISLDIQLLHGPLSMLQPEDPMQAVSRYSRVMALPAKGVETTEGDGWMELGLNVPDMPTAASSPRPDEPGRPQPRPQFVPAGRIEGGVDTPPQTVTSKPPFYTAIYAKWFGVFGAILLLMRHARR